MKKFTGFEKGMGIGGWLTNYKRFAVLPKKWQMILTKGDFEHFDTYITKKDVEYIASLGMSHIRLGFDQLVVEDAPYEYRSHIFDLIEELIKNCKEFNMNVVLNMHKAIGNYCDTDQKIKLLDNEELQKRFIAVWVEFEKRFSKLPDVAFEILNEVTDVDSEKWNNLADETVKAIRKINKERKIIVGSTCWNSVHTLKYLKVFNDENVIYTFHNYQPDCFTHQQSLLRPHYLYYNRKMPYPGDVERYRDYERVVNGNENTYQGYDIIDKKYLYDCLAPAIDFIKQNPDKILWCGEFGTIRYADIKWRENFMKDMISFLKEHDIPYCVWNYLSTPNDGNKFSLVDDDNRKILSENMARIIRGDIDL